jgi:SAM-dependent methyltransferase
MPARYYRMDINSDIFQENDFDLVVNHAAAHHIAYLDRVFLALARTLPENGYFIHFDYVGPHRNQYSLEQWNAAILLNQKLPSHMRSAMQYPSHYAMLHSDPTEAIHSELIIPTLRRYFEIIDQKHAGGALAYLILSHNSNFQIGTPEEQAHYLGMIIEADRAYLEQYPDSSLFDYIVAKPDKTRLDEQSTDKYLLEEDERERKSLQNQGHYYEQHWFQKLNGDLDKQERELAYLRLLKDELDWRTHQLQGVLSELEALRNTRTVKLSKALGNFLNRLRPRG